MRLAEAAEYFMVQKPGIEEVVVQFSTVGVSVSVQQTPGAVEMEMPISFGLVKNLECVNFLKTWVWDRDASGLTLYTQSIMEAASWGLISRGDSFSNECDSNWSACVL